MTSEPRTVSQVTLDAIAFADLLIRETPDLSMRDRIALAYMEGNRIGIEWVRDTVMK